MRRASLWLAPVACVAVASPVFAFQCPALIKEIDESAGKRFDAVAVEARAARERAARLHAEGKHAEAVEAAQAALVKLESK
jgi:hypothetical protein